MSEDKAPITYAIDIDDERIELSCIPDDSSHYKDELSELDDLLNNEKNKISDYSKKIDEMTPHLDKIDVITSMCSGFITGIIDAIFVGPLMQPGTAKIIKGVSSHLKQGKLNNTVNNGFDSIVKKFAELTTNWDGNGDIKSAKRALENHFKVSFDDNGIGGISKNVTDPSGHHFDSLAHHPSLLGLFYAIKDQLTGTTSFINGETIVSESQDFGIHSLPAKICIAVWNWFGHLISDVAGSGTSSGYGMGIPGVLISIASNISGFFKRCHVPFSTFFDKVNDVLRNLFEMGLDLRAEATQSIPVVLNYFFTKLAFSIRRIISLIKENGAQALKMSWKKVIPFKNATVKRMGLIADFAFSSVDLLGAFVKSGGSPGVLLYINYPGLGRLGFTMARESMSVYKRSTMRNKRIKLMMDSLYARDAIIQYKVADNWHTMKNTFKELEDAERVINKSWELSVFSFEEYRNKISPELNNEINKLKDSDRESYLDYLI